uniref:Uncharacterized protein n=1 Tax=Glossina morsitans morsitans TaxID=37546 RepID=A0A1B0G555_GLOMM
MASSNQSKGRWCRREWSSPADTRNADASRRLYSSVFLGSPDQMLKLLLLLLDNDDCDAEADADAEDVAVDDDDDDNDEAELKIFKNRKDTLSLKKYNYGTSASGKFFSSIML